MLVAEAQFESLLQRHRVAYFICYIQKWTTLDACLPMSLSHVLTFLAEEGLCLWGGDDGDGVVLANPFPVLHTHTN